MTTLTERRVLKQITILPQSGTVNVQWADQVLRDGEVVTEQMHRKAYGEKQAAEFAKEVESGDKYAELIGWAGVAA